MSLELEVRSDDDYSRSARRSRITAVLVEGWAAEKKTDDLLIYTGDGCRVEVCLGLPESPENGLEAVEWVGFRVPAGASLESADRSLRMAMAVAREIGWRVFDPQRGGYVDPSELEPGPSFREARARLWEEARVAGWRAFCGKMASRARRQSLAGMAVVLVLGCGAAVTVGWLFRFSVETRPLLSMVLGAGASLVFLALHVVTDVLGEVHQAAVRARRG